MNHTINIKSKKNKFNLNWSGNNFHCTWRIIAYANRKEESIAFVSSRACQGKQFTVTSSIN